MDILLISLPKGNMIKKGKETIPVAALYLNEYLNRNNIDCNYIDFSILYNNTLYSIEDFILNLLKTYIELPKMIGINCFSSYQFQWIIKISENIKNTFPNMQICIGGSHPTFFAYDILKNCKYIDYIVIGEGEEILLSLSNIILNKTNEELKNVQSLGYRNGKYGKNGKNGKNVIINPRKSYLNNLNINPIDLWKNLKFEQYYSDHSLWNNPKNQNIKLAVPIISSRSCPFNCIFCNASKIMGNKIRYRNPMNVVDEIEYLNKEFYQNYFEFIDDNINVNIIHAKQIFKEIINRKLDIQISLASGIHIASADEELIKLMAKAGLAMIKLPIEHGNDYIRNKIIGKKLTKNDIVNIVNILKQYNIFIFGLFIMGFPEETEKTLDDSYKLMIELKLDIYEMASLIPFAGTKLFNQCIQDNILVPEIKYNDLWKGIINFDGSEHDKIYIKPYNMSISELISYRKKFDELRLFSDKAKRMQKG